MRNIRGAKIRKKGDEYLRSFVKMILDKAKLLASFYYIYTPPFFI